MEPSSEQPSDAVDDLAAVIGFACRVPGASNPHELWNAMAELKDLRSEVPLDRFDINAFYHPIGSTKGRVGVLPHSQSVALIASLQTNTRYGYFLDHPIDAFDADFFKISPKEAEAMDPQQRLILEVVYEAMEDGDYSRPRPRVRRLTWVAGLTLESISGTDTSVYCGASTDDYGRVSTHDIVDYPTYANTGASTCMMPNRVSYFYNLKGESVYVNTACSSSLVCLHLGSESIRANCSAMSIIIGSSLILDPRPFLTMADFGMLSADGRSRAFEGTGKGFARGEGVCVMILKLVREAKLHDDPIKALIRGSFSNHSGASTGLTVPSSEAQVELIRRTYRRAGISTRGTSFVEAHGTGTPVGDPKEAEALSTVFGSDGRSQPIDVGSIKTVIGHLEGAAGLIGAIKATMCVQLGWIPGNKQFGSVKKVAFAGIRIPSENIRWQSHKGPRRASVNSFGYGGSNCHCIIEEYVPDFNARSLCQVLLPVNEPYLLPMSCHSKRSGALFSQRLLEYVENTPHFEVGRIAYNLSTKRSLLTHRCHIIARSREDLIDSLQRLKSESGWKSHPKAALRLGFIFTGQGAQWATMGVKLLPVTAFRLALDKCQSALRNLPNRAPQWSIEEELIKVGKESNIYSAAISQPICTAIQIGLVEVLRSWGVIASTIVGHSSGEIAAAYAAGYLDIQTAMLTAYYRGMVCSKSILDGKVIPKGMMIAAVVTHQRAKNVIKAYDGRIQIAAINSPSIITFSGDSKALEKLCSQFEAENVSKTQLVGERAYHSYHLKPLSKAYLKLLELYQFADETAGDKIAMFSSVTGRRVRQNEIGPKYWADNLTDPVRFQDALVDSIIDLDETARVDALVEIGPHPSLERPVKQTMKHIGFNIPYIPTLRRNVSNDLAALLNTAGLLYELGYPVLLEKVLYAASSNEGLKPSRLEGFPHYSWDHRKYWYMSRMTKSSLYLPYQHHLLGSPAGTSTGFCKTWRNFLRLRDLPWLSDHRIQNSLVFPATGFISVAVEAALYEHGIEMEFNEIVVKNLKIRHPLIIPDSDRGTETIFQLAEKFGALNHVKRRCFDFLFSSFPSSEETSTENCSGSIEIILLGGSLQKNAYKVERALQGQFLSYVVSKADLYRRFASIGITYGPEFRLVEGEVRYIGGFARAGVHFEPIPFLAAKQENSFVHPAFLDAVLHPILAATAARYGRLPSEPAVPQSFGSIHFSKDFFTRLRDAPSSILPVTIKTTMVNERKWNADLAVYDPEGDWSVISICNLELQKFGVCTSSPKLQECLYKIRWQPAFTYLKDASATTPTTIDMAIDQFCHQFPRCRILLVSDNAQNHVQKILGHLTVKCSQVKMRRFSKLTVDACDTFFEIPDELMGVVNTEVGVEKVYDLAVVLSHTTTDLRLVLKDNAYILTRRGTMSIGSDCLTKTVELFSTKEYQCGVYKKATKLHSSQIGKLCLVFSKGQDDILREVVECFRCLQVQVETLDFASINSEMLLGSENIVVLSSLADDLLWNGGNSAESSFLREEFSSIKKIIQSKFTHLLWILRGSSLGEISAPQALLIGLLRTARNEHPEARITTLDIPRDCSSPSLCQHLLAILTSREHEDELVLQSLLHIPRLTPVCDYINSRWLAPDGEGRCVLLVGGLGGLGISVARWLVRQGVKHLVFFSRSGASGSAAKILVNDLQESGTRVDIIKGDVTNSTAVRACIAPIKRQLCGVLHMAMVRRDRQLSTMTLKMWHDSVAPKTQGAYNLNRATKNLKLDFFICFSSISGIIGARGQANYAAANCYLDALMMDRRNRGLPGSSLNIGMVADAGMVADDQTLQKKMRLLGFASVDMPDVLQQLDAAITDGRSHQILDHEGFERYRTSTGGSITSKQIFAYGRSITQHLAAVLDANMTEESEETTVSAEVGGNEHLSNRAATFLRKTLARLTGVPVSQVDILRSMVSYGIDSLTAQDVRSSTQKVFGVGISLFDILGSRAIKDIGREIDELVSKSNGVELAQAHSPHRKFDSTSLLQQPRDFSEHVISVLDHRYLPKSLSPYQRIPNVGLPNAAVVTTFTLSGSLSHETMLTAVEELIKRNEILRTSFDLVSGMQSVLPYEDVKYKDFWAYEDLSTKSLSEIRNSLAKYKGRLQSWSPTSDRPCATHLTLVQHSPFSFTLLVALHITITDAKTSSKLVDQLTKIHDCLDRGEDLEAIQLPNVQHIDFSCWYEKHTEAAKDDMSFWQSYLPPFVDHPLFFEDVPEWELAPDIEWGNLSVHLPSSKNLRMRRISGELGVKEYEFLRAVLGFYLAQLSKVDNILIFISDTKQPGVLKNAIGLFYNLLPVICFGSSIDTFEELCARTNLETNNVQKHHGIAFSKIVEQFAEGTAQTGSISFCVEWSPEGRLEAVQANVLSGSNYIASQTGYCSDPQFTDFHFHVSLDLRGDMNIKVTYRADKYLEDDVQSLLNGFKNVLCSTIDDPRRPLHELQQICVVDNC